MAIQIGVYAKISKQTFCKLPWHYEIRIPGQSVNYLIDLVPTGATPQTIREVLLSTASGLVTVSLIAIDCL